MDAQNNRSIIQARSLTMKSLPPYKVELIDPNQNANWDRFVEQHPYGWICHLTGWKRVLENSFKHIRGYYFAIIDNEGNIKAGLPVFYVKSWLTGNRLVSIPFATLCDPLTTESQEIELLLPKVFQLQQKLKARYTEIRSFHATDLFKASGLKARRYYKSHFLLLDKKPELLKRNFHRSCVKQRIARAIKGDLKMKIGFEQRDLLEFYRLQLMTRRRLNLPPQPYRFFQSLWNIFQPEGKISVLLAQKDGMVIAAMMLFKFKDRVSVEYAASDYSFSKVSPNHFLFWEAIKLAYQEGYKVFDFGRTEADNKGLMVFKKRWGTEVVDLPEFYHPGNVVSEAEGDNNKRKRKMAMQLCRYAPDAFQEVIGNFCYRHLG